MISVICHSIPMALFGITKMHFTWEYTTSVTIARIQANIKMDYKSTLKPSTLVWPIHVKHAARSILKQEVLKDTEQQFMRAWHSVASIVHMTQEESLNFWSIKHLFTLSDFNKGNYCKMSNMWQKNSKAIPVKNPHESSYRRDSIQLHIVSHEIQAQKHFDLSWKEAYRI